MSTAAAKAQTAQDQKSADEAKAASGSETKTKEIETPEQISTLQEYQDAVARFRANRTRDPEEDEQTEEAAAPTENETPEETAEEQAEDQTDAKGEETETDDEEKSEETEQAAETKDEEGEEDEEEQEGDTLPKRIRLTNLNKVDAEALLISRRAGISLEEAIPLAKRKLGIAEAPKGEGADKGGEKTPDAERTNGLPGTIEATEAHIAKLKAERKTVFGKDLNFERTAELDEQIDQAREHLASLKETKIRQEVQQQRQFEQKITESKSKAVELYPDVTNPKSALVAKMREVDATLKETGNPLFDAPEKYLKVAQMAANELGIAPRSKKPATKPDTKAEERKPAAEKPDKVKPVTGNARSTQANPIAELSGQLDKVSSIEDFQNFTKTVLPALRKTKTR